jgi:hypothetical protein
MELSLGSRLKRGWNAFRNRDPTHFYREIGASYSARPDRPRLSRGNERSIVTSVYNRIALDAAAIQIQHVRLDENDRFISVIDSGLNRCLTLSANVDQTGRAFIQDVVMSMLDEGCVAVFPVDTDDDPDETGSYTIESMRTGKIVEWYPRHVKVRAYNDRTGLKEDITLSKDVVAIIENPLYAVINEPNSTMQRLIRKLNLLDVIDEQSGSGKLDLIIGLPYVIKTEARRQQADLRRKDIEDQLSGSKYGVAYTDATERITQLNRPVENNLMKQVEYLTSSLYGQLGITLGVMDGTANEETMLNYYNRTIEPIVSAIVDAFKWKYLTKTARSQRQSILFWRDPFKLVPVSSIAEIADKFTRNEIMSPNEVRQVIGMKPSTDPKSEELRNRNVSAPPEAGIADQEPTEEQPLMTQEEYDAAISDLDDMDAQLAEIEGELNEAESVKHYASPYYDPVKAHEYYERTKELKGRRSTASLNEEGKSVASYVKEQLDSERKSKVDASKEKTDSQIERLREQKRQRIKDHREAMQSKIDGLRDTLKNMEPEEKAAAREHIQGVIDGLREDNAAERERLSEEFKNASAGLRAAHKETKAILKAEYDEKYLKELDAIKSEAKYQKPPKESKASKSKVHPLVQAVFDKRKQKGG